MKHLFKPENIKIATIILSIMLFAKLVWFIVEMAFLGVEGVDYVEPSDTKSLYYRTKFAPQKVGQKQIRKSRQTSDISSFKLLAIYHSTDRVVITISKKGKTTVLVRGDKMDGYVLDDATSEEAIFLRNSKSYRLKLAEFNKSANSKSSVNVYKEKLDDVQQNSAPVGEVTDADGLKVVDRTLLEHYSKNMKDIWKNIGISETKKNGKITGFRVNFVKRGSPFARLGLRRGDVIKSINTEELNSYRRAFDIYKNIDTMDSLTLKILRGKKEMELEYEIN